MTKCGVSILAEVFIRKPTGRGAAVLSVLRLLQRLPFSLNGWQMLSQ